jgi:hypothetical protein
MDKRIYLPAIASLLILLLTFTSVGHVAAVTLVARAAPKLEVFTIAEDDELRKTGIMVLGLSPKLPDRSWGEGVGQPGEKPYDEWCQLNPLKCVDKLSQHKILVTFNGAPVTFNVDCQFIKKEKLHPLQKPQIFHTATGTHLGDIGGTEVLRTVLTDESANFECKLREGKPGVGVLDVYYVGIQAKQFIADYIMVVSVWTTIGRTTVYGVDVQDICVLGWAIDDNTIRITKPSGDSHFSWPDALGPFASCEEAALWERDNQGLPVLYD